MKVYENGVVLLQARIGQLLEGFIAKKEQFGLRFIQRLLLLDKLSSYDLDPDFTLYLMV